MQLPDGLIGGVAVLLLGWAAAGTRWLVKLGKRVDGLEGEMVAAKKENGEMMKMLGKHFQDDSREQQEITAEIAALKEKTDGVEEKTGEIGDDVKALLDHFGLTKGLVEGDDED